SNAIFLSLLQLLSDQGTRQVFTGWFAKVHYIVQVFDLSEQQEDELQALRRYLHRVMAQEEIPISENYFLKVIQVLADLIDFFSEEALPENLKSLYEGRNLPRLVFSSKSLPKIAKLRVNILEKKAPKEGEIELVCESEVEGKLRILIKDIQYFSSQDGHMFRVYALSQHCATLVRPNQHLLLTHLERVEGDYLQSTRDTLMVVSPDYLLDATAVANCFLGVRSNSPYLYLLNKLSFFQGNKHTFAGKILNDMLDEHIESREANFKEVFQKVFKNNQLEAAFLELSEENIAEMQIRLKPQYENITWAMQPYLAPEEDPPLIIAEPSFISGIYGLQGRLDLLIEYPKSPNRKDIIELKGTSFPSIQNSKARKDHQVQVACYNLLIDSTFSQRKGVSAVLYAKDLEHPLRDCGKLNFDIQDALWMRNCLVYLDWEISQGSTSFYDVFIQRLEQAQLPPYKLEDLERFRIYWQSASPLEKEFFAELMGLMAREMLSAKVGGGGGIDPHSGQASLWLDSPPEKESRFALMSHLRLLEWQPEKSEIRLHRPPQGGQITAFREGDLIVLYPMEEDGSLRPQSYPLLKGSIAELKADQIRLKVWTQTLDAQYLHTYEHWAIEPTLMESNFSHQFASLTLFLSYEPRKKEVYLGLQAPRFDADFQVDYRPDLSEEQNQLLNAALSAQDYFLLQGPPGTGKTSRMLRYMLTHLYQETEETIVLLAFTNRATDEISEKVSLVCGDDFIRLGNIPENSPYRGQSLKDLENLGQIRLKIHKTRVFVSTVASFYSHFHLIKNYDTLLVDEASQLLDPALCGILPRFRRFILIGDDRQLPAVITQSSSQCHSQGAHLKEKGIKDLSLSVFERLLENARQKQWHQAYNMLGVQYRTHEDIAGFINQEFYKKLRPGRDSQKAPFTFYPSSVDEGWAPLLRSSRLLFIPSPFEPHFKYNQVEAQMVTELLMSIRSLMQTKGGLEEKHVGVITPYRAQIAEISRLLDDELREKVTVDTVERYQGSERDIIIISLAANYPAQMKNLQSFNFDGSVDKKLNVALSRAREQLILIGNPLVIQEGKFYQKLRNYIARFHPFSDSDLSNIAKEIHQSYRSRTPK
ncbi:MAG: AAA domain-containing protein, partial [Bacteroidota bacterium]